MSKGEVAAMAPVLLDTPKLGWGGGRRERPDPFVSPISAERYIQWSILTSTRKDTASVTASIITMEIRHVVGVQTS